MKNKPKIRNGILGCLIEKPNLPNLSRTRAVRYLRTSAEKSICVIELRRVGTELGPSRGGFRLPFRSSGRIACLGGRADIGEAGRFFRVRPTSEIRFRCSDRPLVGRSRRWGPGPATTSIGWLTVVGRSISPNELLLLNDRLNPHPIAAVRGG